MDNNISSDVTLIHNFDICFSSENITIMSRFQLDLSAGFRSDVEKLLRKFSDTDSLRYQSFCEVWKEMKMSFVFAGREDRWELREVGLGSPSGCMIMKYDL